MKSMGLTKALTAVLALSFSTAVCGQNNACLTPTASQCISGTAQVNFDDCGITDDDLPDLKSCLDEIGRDGITFLFLDDNDLTTLPADVFAGMGSLLRLFVRDNAIATIEDNAFADLTSLNRLFLSGNQLTTIESDVFDSLGSLKRLWLQDNNIVTIEDGAFAGMTSLIRLFLDGNGLTAIQPGLFDDLENMQRMRLTDNDLTTLPAGIFENLGDGSTFEELLLDGNDDLQCVPTVNSPFTGALPSTDGLCECTPAAAVACDTEEVCKPGSVGYTCAPACTDDDDCDTANGEVCCPLTDTCEVSDDIDAGACGDPHMTGFRGQKFDFVGKDSGWYAVVSDRPYMHLNMRITAPVPSVPEITYITGISIITIDADGVDHSIVISVADPHSLESGCASGMPTCLAEGALHVVVDGEEVLLAPDMVTVAPDVAIAAVNLPGACRSFGFEKYWERKKLELQAQSDRKLSLINTLQDMSDWVLSDPTATNLAECAEYVADATAVGGVGLFAHQSEHASFQIMTPTAKIRLNHGRLHQLPMRDPTDRFDLPDHLTWQMNLAVDHHDMSLDAMGILGETLVPTVDEHGAPIMQGMDAIRGAQEDYRVKGPLGLVFAQGQSHD